MGNADMLSGLLGTFGRGRCLPDSGLCPRREITLIIRAWAPWEAGERTRRGGAGTHPAVAVWHLPAHHGSRHSAGRAADARELRALAIRRGRAHEPAGRAVLHRGPARLAPRVPVW